MYEAAEYWNEFLLNRPTLQSVKSKTSRRFQIGDGAYVSSYTKRFGLCMERLPPDKYKQYFQRRPVY